MESSEKSLPSVAGVQPRSRQGVIIESASTVDGFRVIQGRIGRQSLVGVVSTSDDFDDPFVPRRLRSLHQRFHNGSGQFALMHGSGRENDAQHLLNEIMRVGILPSPLTYSG